MRILFIDIDFAVDEFVVVLILLNEIYFKIGVQKIVNLLQIYELIVGTTNIS